MKKLDGHYVGMATGGFLALVHAVWSFMVMASLAKPYLDFVLGLHFLNNPFFVKEFMLSTAITLVVVTFVVGYLFGWVFSGIWNRVHGK